MALRMEAVEASTSAVYVCRSGRIASCARRLDAVIGKPLPSPNGPVSVIVTALAPCCR